MKRLVYACLFFLLLAVMPAAAQSAPAADILGEWEFTTVSPVGENTNTVEFRKDGETVKAFAKGPQGEREYDSMQLDGTKLTMVLTIDYQGQPMVITYSGTIADTVINGSADFGGLAMGNFSAARKEAAK